MKKFSILNGSERAYLLHNQQAITWVSNLNNFRELEIQRINMFNEKIF